MVISRNLLIKGNKRAYTIPVFGEQMQTADYVYDELDIYSHKIANEVIFYDKHTLSKPKHHTLGIVKGKTLKFCKFTKGIQYDDPANIFNNESEITVGKALDIASDVNLWFTDDAYWHFLYEDLPVLKHFKDNDYPIVTSPLNSWQKELLNYFGDIKNRIVEVSIPCTITADNFYFYTESNAGGGKNSEWANNFVKDYLQPSKNFSPTKKIYISRQDADVRKVTNEKQVTEHLKAKGFEIVENMPNKSIQEKIDLFAEAQIVISVSGSTLCHVHSMQPGTTVIDVNHLMNLNPARSIQEFAFNNVGDTVGVKWYSILGNTKGFSTLNRARRSMDKDLEIELDVLDKILEQV